MIQRRFSLHLLLLLLAAFATRATAQDFSFLVGGMSTVTKNRANSLLGPENQKSYAWEIDYRHDLGKYFALSGSWLNEGHAFSHHRDGFASQLWADVVSSEHLELALGAGEYRFFDTELLPAGATLNIHGWTPIFSASATFYTKSAWFLRATANHTVQSHGLGTNTLLLGAGYALGKEGKRGMPRGWWETKSTPAELTAYYGRSIVNTGSSEHAVATSVEFRKGLAKNLDWTVSWINEGDPKIIRRNGFAGEVWLVDEYYDSRLSLGIGAGTYWYFDKKHPATSTKYSAQTFAGLVSPTMAYRFAKSWQARLTWNRVISDYNRDADVILLGLGYRWGQGG